MTPSAILCNGLKTNLDVAVNVNLRDVTSPRADELKNNRWRENVQKITGDNRDITPRSNVAPATWSKPNHINHVVKDAPAYTPRTPRGVKDKESSMLAAATGEVVAKVGAENRSPTPRRNREPTAKVT